jgi:phosphate transport system substrate-binding protein
MPRRHAGAFLAPLALCLAMATAPECARGAEPELPPYTRASGVAGNLSSVGSDTLNNLMTLWAEAYRALYPSARVQVEGKGSSTAPPALIEGTAQLGPMSREMKASEIEAFERRFGYPPTRLSVAVDALAIYVHKDNPLERLSLPELDAIFSKGRRCGHARALERWADLGLSGPLGARPIRLYGRNSASGTYGYFKTVALCEGDFRDTTKEQPGSASVVQSIAGDPYGIGYSGIGYRTSGVKTLALASEPGGTYATTDAEEVYAGRYPLARYLYVYVNKRPGAKLDKLTGEFLRFVLSREGQAVVVKDGYLPLAPAVLAAERAKLD